MEFWVCSNCQNKTRFEVDICPKCYKNSLHLIQPKNFIVKEKTKVNLASTTHQITPYYVLLLEDEFGMFYAKKTMQNYEIEEKFNEFKVNSFISKENSLAILKHKHSIYSTILKLLKLTYEETVENSEAYFEILKKQNKIKILLPNFLNKLNTVTISKYKNVLTELIKILDKEFKINLENISFLYEDEEYLKLIKKRILNENFNYENITTIDTNNEFIINISPIIQDKKIGFLDSSISYLTQFSNFDLEKKEIENIQFKNKNVLNINSIIIADQINTYESTNPFYLDLFIASNNLKLLNQITSQVLMQNENFLFRDFEYSLNTEIYGENLTASKTNFYGLPDLNLANTLEILDIIKNFVKETNNDWNHNDWLKLVQKIKENNIKLEENKLGELLEKYRSKFKEEI